MNLYSVNIVAQWIHLFSFQRQTGLPEGAGEDVQTGRGGGGHGDAPRVRSGPAASAAGGISGAAADPAGEAAQEVAPVLAAAAGAARDSSEGSLAVGVVGVVAGHNSDVAEAKQWQVR